MLPPPASPPSPTLVARLPVVGVVVGALALGGLRALVPSALPVEPVRVELPADASLDPDVLRRIVKYPPPSPGSEILETRWTGAALEVHVRIDGPREVVLVDGHGHTTVARLQESGVATLPVLEGYTPAQPFTVFVLSARGRGKVSDATPVLVSLDAR
ncbi:hypothetical protein L6R53_03160 [Myxococcota bacterium]|nr:hypothetical protein [Myxococcota bacterium]